MTQFWSGVFTGVVASIVFWIFQMIIREWLIPKLKSTFRDKNGASVSGSWDVRYNGKDKVIAHIDLNQDGSIVTGSGQVNKTRADEDVTRKYKYTGNMLNNSLVLKFDDETNPLFTGGAMVFHFPNPAVTSFLQGKSIFYKQELNDVDVTEASLTKKP